MSDITGLQRPHPADRHEGVEGRRGQGREGPELEVQILGGTFVTRRGLQAILEAEFGRGLQPESAEASRQVSVVLLAVQGRDALIPAPSVPADLRGRDVVTLAVTDGGSEALVAALAAGYDGVVDIGASAATTVQVVRSALAGYVLLPRELATDLATGRTAPPPEGLGAREAVWLERLASGWSVLEVAETEALSERVMYRRLADLYRRMGVSSRGEAIAAAARSGRLGVAGTAKSA